MCDSYLTIDGIGQPRIRLFAEKDCGGNEIYTIKTGESNLDFKNTPVGYKAKSISIPGPSALAIWGVPRGIYSPYATQINLYGPSYYNFPVEDHFGKIKHPESIATWFQVGKDGNRDWAAFRTACCLGQGDLTKCGQYWTPNIPSSACGNFLIGYCPNNLHEVQCKNYCINNPSKQCTDGALKYCKDNPEDPFCACISANWGPFGTSVPYCIDQTCITKGYKPPEAPKNCQIVECNQIIKVTGDDNSEIKNLKQVCEASIDGRKCVQVSADPMNPKCTKFEGGSNGGNGFNWKQWIQDHLILILIIVFITLVILAFALRIGEKNSP